MAQETICALATPPGRGGVAVIRVSGPAVPELAQAVAGRLPEPRRATLARFRDAEGGVLDEGLLLYFPAPNSFTGEPVLELQGHGGEVVVDRLLRRLHALGARPARPGEFSERAFLNGRMDLTQAEAIADLIAADSEAGARAALRSLEGAFGDAVRALVDGVIRLRVHVEAAIDFSDEEIDFLADEAVAIQLRDLIDQLAALRAQAGQGRVLRDGMQVVLAGPPNAGKSSLLNALTETDTAIVTDIPGTTRDLLREHLHIDGMPLHIIDTAGLRENADQIEAEGIRRARSAMAGADRVLLVQDVREPPVDPGRLDLPCDIPLTRVLNKIDLTGHVSGLQEEGREAVIAVSARTGDGLAELRDHLKTAMGYQAVGSHFSARRRHLDALARSAEHLALARRALEEEMAGEIAAEELRLVQHHLGEITGEFTSEDLLGEIFSSFCIGK